MTYQIEHEVDEFKFIIFFEEDGEVTDVLTLEQDEETNEYKETDINWEDFGEYYRHDIEQAVSLYIYEQALSGGLVVKCEETGDISFMTGGLDD